MKKNGKYRFSLQFGMDSPEEIRAGELLEKLGNKKSKILITALNEYIVNHPELQNGQGQLTVSFQSVPMELLELKIKEVLKSRNDPKPVFKEQVFPNQSVNATNQDILGMIEDLDLFQF